MWHAVAAGVVVALAGVAAVPAHAGEVHRCREAGRVIYQDRACAAGAGATVMPVRGEDPADAERQAAGQMAQRQSRMADAMQHAREKTERRAARQGPAGFPHAAAEAARRGPSAQEGRSAASRRSAATRKVTLRRGRATLARAGADREGEAR
jgi:hypothetical protein